MTPAQIAAIAGCLERLHEEPFDVASDGIWQLEDAAWVLRSWDDVAQLIVEAIDDADGETEGEER
jgi:hypothetical protein